MARRTTGWARPRTASERPFLSRNLAWSRVNRSVRCSRSKPGRSSSPVDQSAGSRSTPRPAGLPPVSTAIAAATKSGRSMWPSKTSLRCFADADRQALRRVGVRRVIAPAVAHCRAIETVERSVDLMQQIAIRTQVGRVPLRGPASESRSAHRRTGPPAVRRIQQPDRELHASSSAVTPSVSGMNVR